MVHSVNYIVMLLLGCLLLDARPSDQIRFASVQIPSLVQYGTNFWLSCRAELAIQEQLYSVKWYRANEEFYRVISSDGLQVAHDAPSSKQQQQYFSQAGLSVRMGASNATHVQMLNASIESEGSYACEISTQNLSTIRYEKELKVYVLPQSRLAVLGFKSRYALGERVELACASNFSRPRGALAWFINDWRIPRSSELFELESESSQSSDGSLTSSKLSLRFRLSAQLLSSILAAPSDAKASGHELRLASSAQRRPNFEQPLELRNYTQFGASLPSHSRQTAVGLAKSGQLAASAAAVGQISADAYQSQPERLEQQRHQQLGLVQQQHQQPLRHQLRLQCKYRLTEISDVTFNEMVAVASVGELGGSQARASGGSGHHHQELGPGGGSGEQSEDGAAADGGHSEGLSRRRRQDYHARATSSPQTAAATAAAARRVRVSRTLANQIVQDKCPTDEQSLRRSLESASTPGSSGCSLGSLALQPDDPLISAPAASDRHQERQDFGHDTGSQGLLELKMGQLVALNCLTIAALTMPSRTTTERDGNDVLKQHDDDLGPITSDRFAPEDEGASVCLDEGARRRLLVSGKSQPVDHAELRQQQNYRNNSKLGHPDRLAQLVLPAGQEGLLVMLGGQQPWRVGHTLQLADQRRLAPSAAPPLLEWFINNQEATKSSGARLRGAAEVGGSLARPTAGSIVAASYQALASEGATSNNQPSEYLEPGARQPPGELTASAEQLLASIDYFDYFANFDARTSGNASSSQQQQQQRLALELLIDKQHFMTPDSRLRLRCSSTQAQVLMADSVQLNIALVGPVASSEPADTSWQKRKRPLGVENSRNRSGLRQQQQQVQRQQPALKGSQQANRANSANKGHEVTFGSLASLLLVVLAVQMLQIRCRSKM